MTEYPGYHVSPKFSAAVNKHETARDFQCKPKGRKHTQSAPHSGLPKEKYQAIAMFYEPGKTDHGLPFDPFKACVVPRPIGWVSTVSATNQTNSAPTANLAPYSQFQNLTFDPPYVMFSANQTPDNTRKDSVVNAESTGIFCWQLATFPLREAVNTTSEQLPYGVDEFERAGLERAYSTRLTPKCHVPNFRGVPMVAESPVRFECEYHSTIRLPGNPPMGTVDIVIGKVVGVYIADHAINLDTGKIDVAKTQPIARCGYYDYAVVRECFEMKMPGDQIMRDGLEGSSKKNREANKDNEKLKLGESGTVEEQHWNGKGAPSTFGADCYDDYKGVAQSMRNGLNGTSGRNGEVKETGTSAVTDERHWSGSGAPSTYGAGML